MKKQAKDPGPCAIHGLMEVLARPWTMHILWTLSTSGPSRVLTQRLRELEERGIVFREYEPTIPPAVTYGITKRMTDIGQILDQLNRLAESWQHEDGSQPSKARVRSAALRPQEIRTH
jgi:DNA-binding HxlR family transcriptional regulator